MTSIVARDLHVGDLWREYDWKLHVTGVDVQGPSVAFAVREFPGTLLHVAADAVLDVDVAL
jgi:hypothetical protein